MSPIAAATLLLADGRFPAGGHAQSAGVESAVRIGDVCDLATLERYLHGRLSTTGSSRRRSPRRHRRPTATNSTCSRPSWMRDCWRRAHGRSVAGSAGRCSALRVPRGRALGSITSRKSAARTASAHRARCGRRGVGRSCARCRHARAAPSGCRRHIVGRPAARRSIRSPSSRCRCERCRSSRRWPATPRSGRRAPPPNSRRSAAHSPRSSPRTTRAGTPVSSSPDTRSPMGTTHDHDHRTTTTTRTTTTIRIRTAATSIRRSRGSANDHCESGSAAPSGAARRPWWARCASCCATSCRWRS